jgi:sortase (surface protein transpeptidase)
MRFIIMHGRVFFMAALMAVALGVGTFAEESEQEKYYRALNEKREAEENAAAEQKRQEEEARKQQEKEDCLNACEYECPRAQRMSLSGQAACENDKRACRAGCNQ